MGKILLRGYVKIRSLFNLILVGLIFICITPHISALANPATVYCEELNNEFGDYHHEIRIDNYGNQYGVCITPDGKDYEDWSFLIGKVGGKYSYCAQKGYDIKTVYGEAICIKKDSKTILGYEDKNYFSEEIQMSELMELDEKIATRGPFQSEKKTIVSFDEMIEEPRISISYDWKTPLSSIYNFSNYSFWDWREPPIGTVYSSDNFVNFDLVNGWMTPVKDQGGCGSCWSFSAHGSVEAKYNIEQNDSRLNPDLSEQHSVSCDSGCYVAWPSTCQEGCNGGFIDLALKFFMENGTVDESCFSYIGSDEVCSSRCSNYQSRLWNISSYNTTWPDGGVQVYLTHNQTKQWLIDYGPMSTSIAAGNSAGCTPGFTSDNGIYRCTLDDTCVNHAVVLVGYNDTGNDSTSYWLIKNSWGSGWGDSGYFKLGFGECNFTAEFDYATNITPPDFKPVITLNSPLDNNEANSSFLDFNFSILNKVSQNSTCDLIVDLSIVNTTTLAQNGTATILSYNLSEGQSNWSVNCWENGMGVVTSSEERVILVGNPIIITINTPTNNSYGNSGVFNVSLNKNGSCFYSIDGSANLTMNSTNNRTFDAINSSISEGEHNLTFSCNDTLNNQDLVSLIFNFDSVSPILNSTSILTASTSTTIYYTSNEIVNTTIDYGTSEELGSSSYSSEYSDSSSVLLSSLVASTLYYYNLTICDMATNCVTKGTYNFTTGDAPAVVTTPSGGGGGGGVATPKVEIYSLENEDLIISKNFAVKKGDKISFEIENNSHSLEIREIETNRIKLTIRSDPINITLSVEEDKKINLTSKDFYDFYIRLESINQTIANISLKKIYEEIPKEKNEETKKEETQREKTNSERKNYLYFATWVLIIFGGWVFYKISKRLYGLVVSGKDKKKLGKSKSPFYFFKHT